MGENLLVLYELMFELARGLWDFQNRINPIRTNQVSFFVKNEANEIYYFEVYFEAHNITNKCKPPQNFDFPETELSLGSFGLKSFYGFVIPP